MDWIKVATSSTLSLRNHHAHPPTQHALSPPWTTTRTQKGTMSAKGTMRTAGAKVRPHQYTFLNFLLLTVTWQPGEVSTWTCHAQEYGQQQQLLWLWLPTWMTMTTTAAAAAANMKGDDTPQHNTTIENERLTLVFNSGGCLPSLPPSTTLKDEHSCSSSRVVGVFQHDHLPPPSSMNIHVCLCWRMVVLCHHHHHHPPIRAYTYAHFWGCTCLPSSSPPLSPPLNMSLAHVCSLFRIPVVDTQKIKLIFKSK